MEITWLGHAAFRLKGSGRTIYIDPVPMEYCGASVKHLFDTLEPADIILLTHEHMDHCSPQAISSLRTPATIIVGPEACREKLKLDVQAVAAGTTMNLGPIGIHAVHAYNLLRQRAPGTPFHPKGHGVGYVVSAGHLTVYHAGDTEPIPEMQEYGPLDVALLPVDGHYTMSPEEALQCAMMVKATTAIPMHFFENAVEFVLAAAKAAAGVRLQVLEVGEVWSPQ